MPSSKRPETLGDLFRSGSNFPQGIPNPDRIGAGVDSNVWSYVRDRSESIAAVSAALQRAPVTIDAAGYEIEITGGAVDAANSRIAWVESRSKDLGDHVDVTFRLLGEHDGRRIVDWEVATYNPYFGCHVGFVAWYGDQIALTYHEKHGQILAVVSASGASLVDIDDEWLHEGDRVMFSAREKGLLEVRRLPDLQARMPRPIECIDERGAIRGLSSSRDELVVDRDAFVSAVAVRLWDAIRRTDAEELVIGSLAYPFWDEGPAPRSTYDRGSRRRRWNSPSWLPFYLGELQNEADRRHYLELLQTAATYSPKPLRPLSISDAAAELGARYIAGRMGPLIKACESHQLPERECSFWYDHSLEAFKEDLGLFPPGLRTAFEALLVHRDKWSKMSGVELA
jgi:hypothetical protein